jgi:prepilin-type N-terminal cleavage/methylation domain-containing protein
MKILKISALKKSQAGFTLIEFIAALAITGLISLGVAIACAQVLNQTARNNDYTTASRNAMNALYWINRDTLVAQSINGTDGFPQTEDLSLSWISWDNSQYSANYTLDNGILRRIYSDGTVVTTTEIARYINSSANMTFCDTENGTLTITITSSVGEGDKVVDVKKSREINSRPNL